MLCLSTIVKWLKAFCRISGLAFCLCTLHWPPNIANIPAAALVTASHLEAMNSQDAKHVQQQLMSLLRHLCQPHTRLASRALLACLAGVERFDCATHASLMLAVIAVSFRQAQADEHRRFKVIKFWKKFTSCGFDMTYNVS